MNRFFRNAIFYVIIFLVIIGIVATFNNNSETAKEISYDEFISKMGDDQIKSFSIQPDRSVYVIDGELKDAVKTDSKVGKDQTTTKFTTYAINSDQLLTQMDKLADDHDVKMTVVPAKQNSGWITFFTSIIPFVIIFILFFFLMSQAQGGGGGGRVMNFGKSKAKLYNDDKKKVRFTDVAGADEEKQELVEVVEFLKDPRKFAELGARIPKGVLLVGPPGTGKTLLARAVAGEAGVPFFSISGSDFVEMFVGVGASRVRDLFENAKKNAPCIIFIDEIDAVGRQRGAGMGGGHDEREQTLNQLLVEMDGFGGNEGIIIIAATNRADVLDPALLRPGRFDRQIMVDRPDVKGREAVLQVHARNKPLAKSVDLKAIAQRTPGFSGADLENLLNEAALVAARSDKKEIDMKDLDEASDRVIAGPAKKNRVISVKERRTVAYHESGHVIVGMVLDEAEVVHKVTIVPRGQAGGYAVMLPKEDRFLMTKAELMDRITGLLGGRVAEEVEFGEVTTGASNDFERATQIARRMVTEWGMSDKIGPLQFTSGNDQVFMGRDFGNGKNYSDKIAYEIDTEVQSLIRYCYDRAKNIILEHRAQHTLIAETLLEVETLDARQIRSLYEDGVMPSEMDADQQMSEFPSEKDEVAPKSFEEEKKEMVEEAKDDKIWDYENKEEKAEKEAESDAPKEVVTEEAPDAEKTPNDDKKGE
ncbi:ATP-dependent zinc metalloprotease FtsH [Listeria booriae]|uniref:ATP-dependent zinc metalloprotease FtsH n=1 Tax=Listeria booriae TaxID=1552123 RepID=A0A099WED7_9LIST|nr:ATP-dependent zinc metalloprotease FtsH [Listeria booriae]KGL43006.1 cell division protein FtsH [Listeria booriae]MBC1558305.1 ATP-dependent metallopeptidase FtsH/Yme1/Tma family protein [Listeria booriae]MBC1566775.1 ATP-dependent metallopeptidase FtsH/Yme1/Tma family protein [Listeria booriae]MBC1796763.1 ATP-dependent metallopeptidase FtsH/Yme1/Tma family protein [Listeria booriae]MBC1801713.1 ATP-dependent metallopeptidase FtsH/Yme1/Tma family protein [Listeria booriae]